MVEEKIILISTKTVKIISEIQNYHRKSLKFQICLDFRNSKIFVLGEPQPQQPASGPRYERKRRENVFSTENADDCENHVPPVHMKTDEEFQMIIGKLQANVRDKNLT